MCYTEVLPHQAGITHYFSVQRFCFARLGINVTSLQQPTTSNCKFWFLTLSNVFFCFPIIVYAFQNIHDLDKATDSLTPFWQILIALFKVVFFKFNSKKIISVIQKLWLWNLEAKAEEHAILASENRKDIIFSNVYHVIVASTGCLAFLSPFAIAGFYAWHGESFWENLEAPARATYVIDKKSVLGYSIICLWNVIFIYSLLYGSVSIDTLFSWLMCNIVAHFRILKYRLRQAGRECNGNRSEKSIYDCIAYHYRTLELAKNFNDAFRAIVFIKFAISCIQICCLAFQLRRGGELFFQVYQGAFLLSVTLQLTLYCYGGQRIENESDSIANIIYDSFHWEALTVSNKKLLIFAMKRSQESCKVSGIFFTANLRLLLWVYRTAASFITLLWTMDEKGNAMQ